MRHINDFDAVSPGEKDDFAFNFAGGLGTDEELSSATWECFVNSDLLAPGATLDPSPASRVDGVATVSAKAPSTKVTMTVQTLSGFVAGNVYTLKATALTTDDSELILWAQVRCEPVSGE